MPFVDAPLRIQVVLRVVIETLPSCDLQTRKELVQRVVASNLICKSARLRDMFLYLCDRVLDESADDIHELELGHNVFGRPEHYDTASDNIVRVHASLLRKRLAEHFQTEGRDEPLTIEIPRGNYAPVFRSRDPLPARPPEVFETKDTVPPSADPAGPIDPVATLAQPLSEHRDARQWILGFAAAGFALLSLFLLARIYEQRPAVEKNSPSGQAVRQFWSAIFPPGSAAQMVLDDASLDFYREATGRTVTLNEYFDRSYLGLVDESAVAAHLDPKLVHSFLLKRQSNFADVGLISRFVQTAATMGGDANVQLARDFSFRQVKAGNVILLGTQQSNPWIQLFDSNLALQWRFDPTLASYYPSDKTANSQELEKFRTSTDGGKPHEGYAAVAFLPNLAGTGNVLIISGTGGAAVSAALDFLLDESSMQQLRSQLEQPKKAHFPYFETLLRVEKGMGLPRHVTIVLCRSPQPVTTADIKPTR